MRFLVAAFSFIMGAALLVSTVMAEDYYIKVIPTSIKGFVVDVQIETNLPGTMTLTARLVYKNQQTDDAFVGTGTVRVPLSNGKATVTIDGIKKAVPHGFPLPDGAYDIEVIYPHLWPDNTKTTQTSGVQTNVKGVATVELRDSTKNSTSTFDSQAGARWVMENVYKGYIWDPQFWQNKFGEMVELEYRGLGDASALTVYYVKSINMSLLIDMRKNIILKYSIGINHD